ncbi:GGDEF domain-containing protein [Aurantiacibacter sp. MUD11]|uniref:GGDEF domain-containing protein n=1 Tax=Aurantiacibacter sp. MUD11 TaxID=3003265 RepID=UPI0022AA1DD1|nr:diguanylate cyclase [Aurantiacibacter sp. MUD11]WAT16968.1 GGDEF domain-containing protein [Aurantiacibacter sp. MUD11]
MTSAFAPGSQCFADAPGSMGYAELSSQPALWNCDPHDMGTHERVALRLDLRDLPAGQAAPDHLKVVRLHFDQMEVVAIGADGSRAAITLGRNELAPGRDLLEAGIPIPQLDTPPVAVMLIVEGAPSAVRWLAAEPVRGPPMRAIAGLDHLLAAMLCGLLLAPIFFDVGFYRTLRNPFPLYHAAFCALAVVQTAAVSGLLLMFTDLAMYTQRAVSILSFDLMVSASSLFILNFVEHGIFNRFHRRLLYGMAAGTAFLGLFASFGLPIVGVSAGTVYYVGYLAYLAALGVILVRALSMGSRAMKFIILAHLPLLLVGVSRVAKALFAPEFVLDTYWVQNLALAFEVIVTAYAVTDRFLKIKRERDLAVTEARTLEELSERDALTGLLNRRAIEARFAALRAEGFTTLAVIDLDHFKSVNDRHGHTAGDHVLKKVAAVLRADDDNSLAFRMGGEEFILLLRGKHALERAEQRRLAITEEASSPRGEPVTASMGIVEAPADALADASFEALYARADRLLYEAKASGRDCTMSERLKVFRPRTSVERRAAA